MDDAKRSLLDKIGKLLALADGARNTSEHEAAAAMAQAKRLMERHRIDSAMLAEAALEEEDANDEDVENAILDAEFGAQLPAWRGALAQAIAASNGCSTYQSRYYEGGTGRARIRLHILGTPTDASASRYMYLYAARQIEDACSHAARENGNPGRTWCANFRMGAVSRVAERVREASKKARAEETQAAVARGATSTALARIEGNDARIARQLTEKKKALGLRSVPRSATRYDSHAREAGRAAGNRVNLGGGSHAALGNGSRGALGQ